MDQKFYEMLREGTLKGATVAELREFLTVKNLPNKGNKNFLIELVEEHFEQMGLSV